MIHFDISGLSEKIKELEKQVSAEGFWDNQETSSKVLTELKRMQNKVEKFNNIKIELKNLEELNELLLLEEDVEMGKALLKATETLKEKIGKIELETLLSGKYDRNNAIVTLHPGAGGTESQDWAEMLYRMYARWGTSNSFEIQEVDYLEGEEAGIKSVHF